MQRIDNGSVDLVFADPPFNIGYEYDEYDDRQEDEAYLDWSRKWIGEVHRVLKPNGTFWLAIGDEYAAELKLLTQKKGRFACRSWVIWYYTFGVNCVRAFSRSHTHLFHFVKDPSDFTFNANNPEVRVMSARQLVYADRRANPNKRLPDNTWFIRPQDVSNGFAPEHDTWYFARVAGTFKEREGFHGCQMPEQLLGRIVRVSSNPGDIVFDPFTGSGTTLVVAKKLGRQWLGTELSKEYAKRINDRLAHTSVGELLDGPANPQDSSPRTNKGKKSGRVRNGNLIPHTDDKTNRGIAAAFRATCEGLSADHVLCNPELNAAFSRACKKSGLHGNAYVWNRILLRIRKSGGLPRCKRRGSRKTFQEMDSYSFASEIGMRIMELDYGLTIDEVLCRPDVALEFDKIASYFAPGFSAFEYRWAALAIRKRSSQSRNLAKAIGKRRLPRSKCQAIHTVCTSEYDCPGVYVLSNDEQSLYVGETLNVKDRIRNVIESENWKTLQPNKVRLFPPTGELHGLQSVLVGQNKPLLNTHLLWPISKSKI
jgi:site-specific DNA-methyltransferase (adenine-specific)